MHFRSGWPFTWSNSVRCFGRIHSITTNGWRVVSPHYESYEFQLTIRKYSSRHVTFLSRKLGRWELQPRVEQHQAQLQLWWTDPTTVSEPPTDPDPAATRANRFDWRYGAICGASTTSLIADPSTAPSRMWIVPRDTCTDFCSSHFFRHIFRSQVTAMSSRNS